MQDSAGAPGMELPWAASAAGHAVRGGEEEPCAAASHGSRASLLGAAVSSAF